MIVVSNSSPLITLARVDRLDLLRQLFGQIHIAEEVYREVVVQGAGRPAASAVKSVNWIETHAASSTAVESLRLRYSLGAGELATIVLAQALNAGLTLLDERMARRLAQARNVSVMGCIGILEMAHQKGLAPALREIYGEILERGIYIDRQLLNRSLTALQLQPL